MESEKQRWEVTYTKHIKQKRKVYQDGFLDLHISANKVMLYDDCEKLLECRVLRKDEVVSSGETLTFNAFLVDVGDHKPLSSGLNTPKFHTNQNQNTSENVRSRTNTKRKMETLSPSHKIIREFKRSELHKYVVPQSSPNTKKSNTTEWQVLYTHQLTKKAKTYHDGFLQLSACGSMARQIMLFDESRKLLDSRFLKKDEVVRSGESISLSGHLVEIGDCEGDQSQTTSSNVAVKLESRHERKSDSVSNKNAKKVQNQNEFTIFEKAEKSVDMEKSNMTGLHEFNESANMNTRLRNAHQILSVLSKPVQESTFGCTSKRMTSAFSSTKKVQICTRLKNIFPKCTQYQKSSIPHQGSSENFGIEESSEYVKTGKFTEHLETCKVTSDCGSHQVLKEMDSRDSSQSNTTNSEVDVKHYDKATAASASSLMASKRSDNKETHSKEPNVVEVSSEMPTFDLGF